MSKNRYEPKQPVPVTGTFFTVAKQSHLLYEAFEITVKDGVVTDVKNISRAPDLAHTAVAICQRELWVKLRVQNKETVAPNV
jgi:hypothetical protein